MIQAFQETAEVTRVVLKTPTPEDLSVSVSVTIKADMRRIVNALTITEYMDTWMHMPEVDEFLCCAEDNTLDNFRFDLYSSRGIQASIHGYCLLATPDHLMYVWRKTSCEAGKGTIVDIHLQHRINHCILTLKHSGICSMQESLWHASMWKRSLENLCRLMEA